MTDEAETPKWVWAYEGENGWADANVTWENTRGVKYVRDDITPKMKPINWVIFQDGFWGNGCLNYIIRPIDGPDGYWRWTRVRGNPRTWVLCEERGLEAVKKAVWADYKSYMNQFFEGEL